MGVFPVIMHQDKDTKTMSKSKPSGGRLNQSGLARLFGVSAAAVCKAVKRGRLVLDADGRLDQDEAVRQWVTTKDYKFVSTPTQRQKAEGMTNAEAVLASYNPGAEIVGKRSKSDIQNMFAEARLERDIQDARLAYLKANEKESRLADKTLVAVKVSRAADKVFSAFGSIWVGLLVDSIIEDFETIVKAQGANIPKAIKGTMKAKAEETLRSSLDVTLAPLRQEITI